MTALTFGAPAVLWALLLLPVLWWLLRATPPRPRDITFAPTRLLLGLMKREETATRTPWWLMAIRLALGLHQQDVADAGGLNRNTVGAIESGKRNPSLDIFSRYCRGLLVAGSLPGFQFQFGANGYEVSIKPIEEG